MPQPLSAPDEVSHIDRLRRRLTLGLPLVLGATVAAGWWRSQTPNRYDQIIKRSVIRIGFAVEAPYALVRTDGRVSGEAPEVARLVAAMLGIRRIEWVLTSFDALIVDLLEERFDLIVGGMFVTRDRAQILRYCEPSLRVLPGFLVRTGNPRGIYYSYAQTVAAPGLRIAAVSGSVEARQLRDAGMPAERLFLVPDAPSGRAAVDSGLADGLALSYPAVRWMASHAPDRLQAIPLAGHAAPVAYTASAVAESEPELWRAWNEAQAKVLGSDAHLQAIAPFGLDITDLPGQIGLKEILEQ